MTPRPAVGPAFRVLAVVLCAATLLSVTRSVGAEPKGTGHEIPSPGFRRPVPGSGPPARAFDPPEERWNSGHRGVDLSATAGDPVLSPASGRVAFVGVVGGKPVVSVDHPGGLRTTYEPVTSILTAGTDVRAGVVLGILAPRHPGCPVASCLHWGARFGERYVDPMSLLAADSRPIRLLPLRPGDVG